MSKTTPAKDYSTARYWVISDVAYGKGFTAEEARLNYRATLRRDFSHLTEEEIEEFTPDVAWHAPEEATGFFSGYFMDGGPKIMWTKDNGETNVRRAEAADLIEMEA